MPAPSLRQTGGELQRAGVGSGGAQQRCAADLGEEVGAERRRWGRARSGRRGRRPRAEPGPNPTPERQGRPCCGAAARVSRRGGAGAGRAARPGAGVGGRARRCRRWGRERAAARRWRAQSGRCGLVRQGLPVPVPGAKLQHLELGGERGYVTASVQRDAPVSAPARRLDCRSPESWRLPPVMQSNLKYPNTLSGL